MVCGRHDWESLIGEAISFDWTDGWDDYDPYGTLTRIVGMDDEDPRYPRFYVHVDNGIFAVRESDNVAVTVHEKEEA